MVSVLMSFGSFDVLFNIIACHFYYSLHFSPAGCIKQTQFAVCVSQSTMGKSKGKGKRAPVAGSDEESVVDTESISLDVTESVDFSVSSHDHVDVDQSALHFLSGATTIVTVENVEDIRDSSSSPDVRVWVHPSRMLEERLAAGGLVAVRKSLFFKTMLLAAT